MLAEVLVCSATADIVRRSDALTDRCSASLLRAGETFAASFDLFLSISSPEEDPLFAEMLNAYVDFILKFGKINRDLRKIFEASIRVSWHAYGDKSDELCRAHINYALFHRYTRDFSSSMLEQIDLAIQ